MFSPSSRQAGCPVPVCLWTHCSPHSYQQLSRSGPDTYTPRLGHTSCDFSCDGGLSPVVCLERPPRNMPWSDLRHDQCRVGFRPPAPASAFCWMLLPGQFCHQAHLSRDLMGAVACLSQACPPAPAFMCTSWWWVMLFTQPRFPTWVGALA